MGKGVKLPELFPGTLLRRYKRFLADLELPGGGMLTVHCPNTGAMTGCAEPGSSVWYSKSDNPKRKYPHTLEMVETSGGIVSVNTGRANQLVGEALREKPLAGLGELSEIKAEAKIPEGDGRFDFAARSTTADVYIEVKSTTLLVDDRGTGAFPDAVSSRALKHVQALSRRVAAGDRGVLIFCAQHCGIQKVRAAHEVDAAYAAGLLDAQQAGVEVLAYACATDLSHMWLAEQIPFLPPN